MHKSNLEKDTFLITEFGTNVCGPHFEARTSEGFLALPVYDCTSNAWSGSATGLYYTLLFFCIIWVTAIDGAGRSLIVVLAVCELVCVRASIAQPFDREEVTV